MDDRDWLAERFEAHRPHLRAVAYRMLGSAAEADDALQEAWLRASRAGADDVDNLGGWLTTVVARVCLNQLRSRRSRPEESLDEQAAQVADGGADPEAEALLADAVGPALLVVLDTLSPAERLAFVLHDLFAVPFGEIAEILGRSPAAARQLASRARRRVQGAQAPAGERARQRLVVEAFLAASREGDFEALLGLLDPQVVARADAAATGTGAPRMVRGAAAVAGQALSFAGRASYARAALVDGAVGLVVAPPGRPARVLGFTIRGGRIAAIDILADPERLRRLDLALLGG
ncbi:MAG TPA: sigma-70 family RNA polymerase sigma factor [Actinomycetota bacterium]|nr:sigma-70 family RNA polymerase sigma factor [Actinomycetota bacterium]